MSGKMAVLACMLEKLRPMGDRIVVVSNSTQVLDLVGTLCRERNVSLATPSPPPIIQEPVAMLCCCSANDIWGAPNALGMVEGHAGDFDSEVRVHHSCTAKFAHFQPLSDTGAAMREKWL